MAEKDQTFGIPWLPLITLIMVGGGLLIAFQPLTSSRPGGGNTRLAVDTFDDQAVDARLWQDPWGVAVADLEKPQKDGTAHSITRFQDRLMEECFPKVPTRTPEENARSAKKEKELQILARRLQVLAVMIPGGPYVEDVERRLRSRRAVIEGLETTGYGPEKDHQIAYFCIPWPNIDPNIAACVSTLQKNRGEDETRWFPRTPEIRSTRSTAIVAGDLIVPYEWYELTRRDDSEKPERLLVLWLIDDAFRDAPLARLADLISWFRFTICDQDPFLPVFKVLGPDNSGTLRKMVIEANVAPWNEDTRQCLAATHIYSSQASVAETQLFDGLSEVGKPRTSKDLIEQEVNEQDVNEQDVKSLHPRSDFSFERTNPSDEQIVATLWQEVERRGLKIKDKLPDHIAIISERDTYYARALCSTFEQGAPRIDKKTPRKDIVKSYFYLRGIDGKIPSNEKDEKEKKDSEEAADKNAKSNSRPTERTEGLSQADDIRRLAEQLKPDKKLKAVGLLGSDVYDKLELLKALRPILPDAVFFTNNVDARFTHPDEMNETHNLVIVSAYDLSLCKNQPAPPFRDSYQTALFAATREAIGQIHDATPKFPFIFEIGRNGYTNLTESAPKNLKERAKQVGAAVGPVIGGTAFLILLSIWIIIVSHVPETNIEPHTDNLGITPDEDPNDRG